MKIKFDENISVRFVRALREFEKDSSIELSSLKEDYGEGIADPDWMFRFSKEGGLGFISGDFDILQRPANRIAYIESGLVSIWVPRQWAKMKRWTQAGLMIIWWPVLLKCIRDSSPGKCWRFPAQFTPGQARLEVLEDPRS